MESFWTVWKVYRWSGKFPYSMEIFLTVWIYALLAHICHERKFTHFWRIYVAKTIYALRPESFWAWNSANRKVLTFCVSAGQPIRPTQWKRLQDGNGLLTKALDFFVNPKNAGVWDPCDQCSLDDRCWTTIQLQRPKGPKADGAP